jgi:NAD(P)-dependent dehydrogenase (short-subunit alcohol dehydrogenase family)
MTGAGAATASPALQDKVIVITGVASGIGKATFSVFREAGATVCGMDASQESLADETFDGALTAVVDVTAVPDVETFMASVVERHGGIDGLVNCAGVGVLGDEPTPVGETTDHVWNRTLEINLTGSFISSRAVLPALLVNGGSIVNIASVMGLVGNAGAAAYCASKAGVLGLTRAMALEYADQGVRVNALCPGYIDTPMVRRYLTQVEDAEAQLAELRATHPIGRLGRSEEVAAAALWLTSDAASFMTGAAVPVDGGFTAR